MASSLAAGNPTAFQDFARHTRRDPCPVCGKPDWCRTFADGWTECMRVPSDRPYASGGWGHWTGPGDRPGRDWRDALAAAKPAPPSAPTPLDGDILDRVYRRLLERCPLSDGHRAHLAGRGLTEEQIERHGYGSLPEGLAREAVVAELVTAFGPEIVGRVPGLYARPTGAPALAGWAGLLIPARDAAGRTVGCQVRPDDPAVRAAGKYRHLSSGTLPAGVGNGAPCHLARPAGATATARAVVAEGWLKGNLVADKLGLPVVCTPGATVTREVGRILRELGAAEVVIAYDNDKRTNPTVAHAEAGLIEALQDAGFAVWRAAWPEPFKGLDDALAAGVLPLLEPVATGGSPAPAAAPCAEQLAAKERELADLRARLAEADRRHRDLSRFHSIMVAAYRAPHLGPERQTGTTMVVDLAAAPRGEWRPMPYARVADQAGVSARAVPRHLELLRPIFGDTVELKQEFVPPRVDPETGAVSGGHKQTFARLTADPAAALRRIATAVPTGGHRNGHGGRRLACPDCGDAGVVRSWVACCAGCGRILDKGQTRIPPGEGQPGPDPDDDPPARPGPCHLDMVASEAEFPADTGDEPPAVGSCRSVMDPLGTADTAAIGSCRPVVDPSGVVDLTLPPVPVHRDANMASYHNDEPAWPAQEPEPEADDGQSIVMSSEQDAQSVGGAWLGGQPWDPLGPARRALAAADHAADPGDQKRAAAALAARLAPLAQARGRAPVPKPGPTRRDRPPPVPCAREGEASWP